ncbi:MAG: carboxypeptidase-like regulatory domain-containing protein, partial [Candidatus Korobacteraceae bacterium]
MQSAPGRSQQIRRTLLMAFAFLLVPLAVWAQNSTSTLRGVVQDPSARRVVGAQVVVRLTGSGSSIAREAVANDRGEFRIDGLLPGPYQVTATAKGFAEATADVDTAVSVVRDITITLKPAGAHETVNVPGNASGITTETLDTSSAV